MPVTLRDPQDLDLRAYRRIAWDGEGVELDPGALERIAERRAAFDAFVAANEGERLYGVTTAHHRGASTLLSPAARVAYARRVPPVPATFGPSLPERLVRGIVAARVAGFIGGGSAVRPELALAVAAMLDGPMPHVPARGHGDPGEIIALGATFAHLEDVVALEAKEGMALVNGAPCAAAALADAALGARGRLVAAGGGIRPRARGRARAACAPRSRARRDLARPARGRVAAEPADAARGWRDRASIPSGRGRLPRCAPTPRLVSTCPPAGRGVRRDLAVRSRGQPDVRAGRCGCACAPALERGVPRPARCARVECAGRVVRGPGEPGRGPGDPAGRGSGWARGGRGRAVRDAALDDGARLGRGGARRGSADADLARRQRPERHVVAGAAGLASRGGCRDLPAGGAGVSRDPRVAHDLTRRDGARPRGCSIGSTRSIAAFPIGSQPRDWSAGLELVAHAIERQVRESR